jgi:hypothetical protein
MSGQRFYLRTDHARRAASAYVASVPVDDDRPLVVQIKEMTRNDEQNKKFHAMCGDVAKQAKYAGRELTAHQWKVLFISGHSIATGAGADMVPGLENEFVNIRESSAQMGVRRMASLIEYVQAWCVMNGVRLCDQDRQGGTQ